MTETKKLPWPLRIIRAPFFLFAWLYITFRDLSTRFHGRKSRLERAIKRAEKLHKRTGKRYRVFFIAGRYRVYKRADIKDRKKAGIFNRYINSTNIDHLKFYDTYNPQPCLSK